MGAVSWDYVVPYQRDIAQALQQLRQQVFASGAFYNWRAKEAEKLAHLRSIDDATYQTKINYEREHPEEGVLQCVIDMFPSSTPMTSEQRTHYLNRLKEDFRNGTQFVHWPPEQTRDEAIADLEQSLERLPEVKAFDDVEALWYDDQGTRSILDIDHIAPEFEAHAVTPLKPQTLMAIFGTQKPTRELIDAHWDKLGHIVPEFEAQIYTPQETEALMAMMMGVVGTEKQARELLDALWHKVERPRRWEGVYIIVWRDDIPDEILFHGCSPL